MSKQAIINIFEQQQVRTFWDEVQEKWYYMRFAQAFPEQEIISTGWRKLSWSHMKALIYIKIPPHFFLFVSNRIKMDNQIYLTLRNP